MVGYWAVLLFFFLSLFHGIQTDHVVDIASLMEKNDINKRLFYVSLRVGMFHVICFLFVAVLSYFLFAALPFFECLPAFLFLLFGIHTFYLFSFCPEVVHQHDHAHEHVHPHPKLNPKEHKTEHGKGHKHSLPADIDKGGEFEDSGHVHVHEHDHQHLHIHQANETDHSSENEHEHTHYRKIFNRVFQKKGVLFFLSIGAFTALSPMAFWISGTIALFVGFTFSAYVNGVF